MELLSGVLFSLYRGTPNHGQWVVSCLEGSWGRLLGDRLASVCRPVRLEGRELTIEILDREWEPAVKSVRDALLEKLQSATTGEVRSLTFSR